MQKFNYIMVKYPEPHLQRGQEIFKKYPQVRQLFGNDPRSFVWSVALLSIQLALAAYVAGQPLWVSFVIAYLLGAICNHALFVLVHDASHNLIFKSVVANYWAGFVANFAIFFPMSVAFRRYHLIHHRSQGEMERDADLSGEGEAAWVGDSPVRKALWLLGFFVVEGIVRPLRLKQISVMGDKWVILNNIVQAAFLATVFVLFGWKAVLYLFLSTAFAIGLHPLGARWIQEHYVVHENQETYSYYGPANKIAFNVGYHNEHHDFMMVPWSRLPQIKAMAPEYYDTLYSHRSYVRLFFRFLFDRKLTLFSRVIRESNRAAIKPGIAVAAAMAVAENARATGTEARV